MSFSACDDSAGVRVFGAVEYGGGEFVRGEWRELGSWKMRWVLEALG